MSESLVNFGIIGNGNQANEIQSYGLGSAVIFRAVDRPYLSDDATVDVTNPSEDQRNTPVVAAIGAPGARKEMMERWPGREYVNVVSPHAIVDSSVRFGGGCIVAPGAILTTDILVGKHTTINIASTVSHSCEIGEYVTISPGVHIAGDVVLGDGVFIGIGAILSNDIKVASGSVIGAGAVVVDDIEDENCIYVGTPARKIGQNEGWLREI